MNISIFNNSYEKHTIMEYSSQWLENKAFVVANHRGHRLKVDLPAEGGGDDTGATAEELFQMALSALVASGLIYQFECEGIPFDNLSVKVNWVPDDQLNCHILIKSPASMEVLEGCWEKSLYANKELQTLKRGGTSIGCQFEKVKSSF